MNGRFASEVLTRQVRPDLQDWDWMLVSDSLDLDDMSSIKHGGGEMGVLTCQRQPQPLLCS